MTSPGDISTRFRLWREDIRASLLFLTVAPVGGPPPVMPRALRAFPIAGGLVGGLGAMALLGALGLGISPLAASFTALITMAALTGALHEDGLADTADGFGGGVTAEDKLRIMGDSRIGTFGTVSLFLVLGLKAALLTDLAGDHTPVEVICALVAAAALGRFAAVGVLWALPPARDHGLGSSVGRPDLTIMLSGCAGLGVMTLPMFLVIDIGAVATGLLIAAMAVLGLCLLSRRQIGGQTGDIAGAGVLLAETGFYAGMTGL